MKIFSTFLISLITVLAFCNDGTYLSSGGVIYPTIETKISLEKEILSFTVRDDIAQVDILFEFNNPEKVERKLLIGFQAPTAAGDVSDKTASTCQIKDFTIQKDGLLIPYVLKAAECEDCELKAPNAFSFSQEESGIFVFLFEVTFKPGLNSINHSYNFPASGNVAFDQLYNYILTTGAKWANNQIKDLTIHFDLGNNKYFFVNDVFGPTAAWSIIGTGKVTDKMINLGKDKGRMIRVLNGKLQVSVKDFTPTKNVDFGIINKHSFITQPTDYETLESNSVIDLSYLRFDEEANYSKKELRLMRNTIYAQYGYKFKDEALLRYFTQFDWYIPNPNLKISQIELNKLEEQFIKAITAKEKE